MSDRRKLTRRRGLVASGLLAATAGAMAQGKDKDAVKVVYHVNDTEAQATGALRNIRNHLDAAPDTRIIVVTHASGIDFLMNDARDAKDDNIEYASLVSALTARGVHFEVCRNTLETRGLSEDAFILDAEFVQSGVARIGQLQYQDGYAYIKP
ncbi:MAG: DsrE family protein [Ottowia sp.]|nr:DsrE family protein [Ottowia sp.]